MRKILVPYDGSNNAMRATQYAALLAKDIPDTEVDLLNVQEPSLVREHANLSAQEIKSKQDEDADRTLQQAKQILDDAGVNCSVHCRIGSPAIEIAQYVREADCDTVVMGSRGLGQIYGLVLGSVATKVIHLVDVPVTIVK